MQLKDLAEPQALRVSALIDEALELPPARRAAWHAELAEREPRLHGLVTELLAAMERSAGEPVPETRELIERRFAEATRIAPPAHAVEGRSFGPYRVLRLLGRGGMGTVWLAERSDGLFERQIALKLVHPSQGGSTLTERFARERGILAALDHPHIARLLDAGVSADGQPYLALEYVEGISLTSYCDAERLTVKARIALVVQVLSAVQHAHQNLVVHRDLKPSNILVTADGQAHLLDFGIAKLMVEGVARETELTELGGRALTPDYASPEQIAGRPVSTASDVYSLGVLLYELLCGQRPYQLTRDSRGALEDAILNAEPVRPSQRVLSDDVAHARSTTPKRLARSLAGDLDTIMLKALKKNSAERYATADSFRQDLQRHLNGEAVLARPDTAVYRTARFVQRHRFGVAATALVLLTLGAGLVGTAWQARQARQEARRAEAVKLFLVGLFNQADPAKAQGRELSAREMLDRGQQELKTKLSDQPRLKAELIGVLAQLYTKLDAAQTALPLAESWRDMALQLDGPNNLAYGDALFYLAEIQGELRRHDAAYANLVHARDVFRNHADARKSELLKIESSMAYELSELGRFKEASEVLASAIPRMEANFGPNSWEVIDGMAALSHAYMGSGKTAYAVAIDRQIEPLLDTTDAAHAMDVPGVRTSIAINRMATWHPDEALPLLRKALESFEHLVGPETPGAVSIQRSLAYALYANGQFAEAARMFDDNVARAVRVAGEDNPGTKLCESYSVRALILVGRATDAESMARRSLAGAPNPASTQTTSVRDFENRLALALIFNHKADEAAALLALRASEARQAGLAHGDDFGRLLHYLAGAMLAQGRFNEATALAREAEQVFEGSNLGRDMYMAHSQLTQALALARGGQPARARELVAQAESHFQQVTKPDHPVHLMAQLVQAEALRAGGHVIEADAIDRSARERLQATSGAVLPKIIPLIF